MSQDDECDWFDKDEDDLVNNLKAKVDFPEETTTEYIAAAIVKEDGIKIIEDRTPQNSSAPKKLIATAKLREISLMDPLDTFLFAATTESDFFYDQIKPNDAMDRVLLYISVLVKIVGLELPGYYMPVVTAFAENVPLLDHICELNRKLFSKKYKALWTDISKVDDIVSGMEFLFQRVHLLRLQTESFCNAISHIIKTVEKADVPTVIDRPVCQSFIKTLGNIVAASDEKHLRESKEIYPTLEELVQTDSKLQNDDETMMSDEKHLRESKEIYLTLEELALTDSKLQNDEETIESGVLAKNYNNIREYISVQKHLLREDFMIPLRECVNSLKTTHKVSSNCLLFEDVYIMMNQKLLQTNRSEIIFVDILGSRRKNETMVKKTMQKTLQSIKIGALLCFTTSLNFEDLILATVTHNGGEMQSTGYIFINVVRQFNIGQIYNRSLFMFESPAFFEPYNNVFNVLNSCNSIDISMQQYIIGGEVCPMAPAYLKQNSINTFYKGIESLYERAKLNDSQKLAFQNALSQEFCLIQGPPGTGKTHLSVEIVHTLLQNSNVGPIALIAYTNESLDKFLLKLKMNTTNIARFGTRSKIPQFTIQEEQKPVNPLLKRLYYITDLLYKEQFNVLQKLYKNFDGSEESYQLIISAQEKIHDTRMKLDTIRILFRYYNVREKQIMAMTTTYAAKMSYLFKLLKTRIMVFEEAAEILESHVLACLTRHTQHVLMIGDHKQLQPFTFNRQHSRKHHLNVSLFERLIKRKMAYTPLFVQYRLRPEFVDLICPSIYKRVENAENVLGYEDVNGMEKNLFFLSHEEPETADENECSKSNKYECNQLLELAKHLVFEENNAKQIVVLSPYIQQVELISKTFKKHSTLRDIQIATVDQFQGREADIVLLSLVRSNSNREIGFLSNNNRICVALSRAKKGLYIIGDMNLLAQRSKLWKRIKAVLCTKEAIGKEFPCV